MTDPGNRQQTIRDLSRRLRHLEQVGGQPANGQSIVSTGLSALDELLPERGVPPGTLVEWLGDGPGHGAAMLALTLAGNVLRANDACVVIDERRGFYRARL